MFDEAHNIVVMPWPKNPGYTAEYDLQTEDATVSLIEFETGTDETLDGSEFTYARVIGGKLGPFILDRDMLCEVFGAAEVAKCEAYLTDNHVADIEVAA